MHFAVAFVVLSACGASVGGTVAAPVADLASPADMAGPPPPDPMPPEGFVNPCTQDPCMGMQPVRTRQ